MGTSASSWLVTGASGLLGREITAKLTHGGARIRAADHAQLDITDVDAVSRAVEGVDAVINCAGYTDVDGAEQDESAAFAVNARGVEILAQACAQAGSRLVHLSTDYVFSGEADRPYGEDTPRQPRSVYGRSKAAGEQAVLDSGAQAWVVRTAWLYGEHGPCFPRTIGRLLRERGHVDVVDDQMGQPTWTRDVADFVVALVETSPSSGVFHATSSGQASWYDFACEIAAAMGLDAAVAPTSSADFPRAADRPSWSVLGHDATSRAGLSPIGDWRGRWHAAAALVLGDWYDYSSNSDRR